MATYNTSIRLGSNITATVTQTDGPLGALYTTVIIAGYGPMYNSYSDFVRVDDNLPFGNQWLNFISDLDQISLNVPAGITSIAERCFENIDVDEIYLPNSLREISDAAFRSNGHHLTNIIIGPNVDTIGAEAFYGQTSLTKLDFHDNSNMQIYKGAFMNCENLEYIGLGDDWEYETGSVSGVFYSSHVVSHSVFYGCNKLSRLSPNNIIHDFHNYMYYKCNKLGHVKIIDPGYDIPDQDSFYVELFDGDNLDEDGNYITYIDSESEIGPYIEIYPWTFRCHRVFEYVSSECLYLEHNNVRYEIGLTNEGDLKVLHNGTTKSIKLQALNGTNFDSTQPPVFFLRNNIFYQLKR